MGYVAPVVAGYSKAFAGSWWAILSFKGSISGTVSYPDPTFS